MIQKSYILKIFNTILVLIIIIIMLVLFYFHIFCKIEMKIAIKLFTFNKCLVIHHSLDYNNGHWTAFRLKSREAKRRLHQNKIKNANIRFGVRPTAVRKVVCSLAASISALLLWLRHFRKASATLITYSSFIS